MVCIRKLLYMIITLAMTVMKVQAGSVYRFNPATGPWYIWHSHILDHENSETVRPYLVV